MADVALAASFPEAELVGRLLEQRGLTIATAESCTGGLLSAVLTAIPGSSRWVRGGIVAYSNDIKVSLLAVDASTLAREGAVSAAVAEQMARGVRRRCGADVGVGITGIAGPGADDSSKQVGLIYVSVADAAGIRSIRLTGDNGRESNRAGAVVAALRLIAAPRVADAPSTNG